MNGQTTEEFVRSLEVQDILERKPLYQNLNQKHKNYMGEDCDHSQNASG